MKYLYGGFLFFVSFNIFSMDQELETAVNDFYKKRELRHKAANRNEDKLKTAAALMVQLREKNGNLDNDKPTDEKKENN